MNIQPFSQTGQMIELCCEYLYAWCIWLYVLIMSFTHFRVNPLSAVAWISKNSLLETGMTATGLELTNTQPFSQSGQMIELCVVSTIFMVHLAVCFYHVTYMFHLTNLAKCLSVHLRGLSGFGFKSCCCHLHFRYYACFEQGVVWHSGNYGIWEVVLLVGCSQLCLSSNHIAKFIEYQYLRKESIGILVFFCVELVINRR